MYGTYFQILVKKFPIKLNNIKKKNLGVNEDDLLVVKKKYIIENCLHSSYVQNQNFATSHVGVRLAR